MRRGAFGLFGVAGIAIARWLAGNYLWQLLFSAGLGSALSVLTSPLVGLHGARLVLFGIAVAVMLMGVALYAVKFLPEPPLPANEKEALSRARADEENLRQSLPPWRSELEHNRGILETAQGEGVFWSYADGERLESDEWNNRKSNNIKLDSQEKKVFWMAMDRAHREFNRLNQKAIKAGEQSPPNLAIPDTSVLDVALEWLAQAEEELEALW
jgi:hypothetical protein